MNNYQNCQQQTRPWCKLIIKPLTFLVVSTTLACAISQLCGRFGSPETLLAIWTDLRGLKTNINTVSKRVDEIGLTKNEIDKKLTEIALIIPKLAEASLKLRSDISEEMAQHTKKVLETLTPSIDYIRNLIKEEINLYDADKIGLTDYALESSGGAIVTTPNTESYTRGLPALTLLGVPLCHATNSPRSIIQATVFPGECWAFKGTSGSVVIQLLGKVHVESITLEHISRILSPSGNIGSAPRDFSVWGLTKIDDVDGFFYGQFTYDEKGEPLQRFTVQHLSTKAHPLVELKIHSNQGQPLYTCVYRFRVHGLLEQQKSRGLR